jgi:hypothetical protein
VEGVRHSIVVFILQDIFDWKRLGEYYEDRDERDQESDKERQQIWRKEVRYKGYSCLPLPKNGKKNGENE